MKTIVLDIQDDYYTKFVLFARGVAKRRRESRRIAKRLAFKRDAFSD